MVVTSPVTFIANRSPSIARIIFLTCTSDPALNSHSLWNSFVLNDPQSPFKLSLNLANGLWFLPWQFCSCLALTYHNSRPCPFLIRSLSAPPPKSFLILSTRDYHFFLWLLHGIYLDLFYYINLMQQCIILNYMLSGFFPVCFVFFSTVLFYTLKTEIHVIVGSHMLREGLQIF